MCGIAGIKSFNIVSKDTPARMLDAMNRRGPDDSGIWFSKDHRVSLAHARLSIIDLSEGGHQPMVTKDSRLSIVFNGEIFNYANLKQELIQAGYTFQNASDTEVILVGWQAWGMELVKRLRGMFAFALWDEDESSLYLVRDRLGIKPLLYVENNGELLFASTLEAILASGKIEKKLSYAALCDLFSLGSVIQPRTLIEGVKSLDPGSILKINQSAQKEFVKYWDFTPNPYLIEEIASLPYEEQVKHLQFLLEEACRYHMIADVPIGSFLSGGVDSSSITALMSKLSTNPIKTFSIGFNNQKGLTNELSEAAEAAAFLGCEHHELILDGKMVESCFDDFISVIDQPSYDGINTYWVSKMASQSVKVTLSGLGGDELFGGYGHFEWPAQYIHQQNRLPFLGDIYRKFPTRLARTRNLYLKFTDGYGRLSSLRRLNYNSGLRSIFHKSVHLPLSHRDWVAEQIEHQGLLNRSDIDTLTQYECSNYLKNTLLRDGDALSMGHGLEVRPILLDNSLIDFAIALPYESKIRKGRAKAILKDACADLLPKGYFDRPKKGFTLPTVYWLQKELSNRMSEALTSKEAKFIFDSKYLQYAIPSQIKKGYGLTPWMLLVLIEWIRRNNITL